MSDEEDDDQKIITIGFNKLNSRGGSRGSSRAKGLRPIDEYQKTHPSLQDRISENVELFESKIENFDPIADKDYADISVGTFIRYITFDKHQQPKLRLGGYLVNNKAPQYWVLRSGSRGKKHITWSVNLQAKPANIFFKRKGVPTKSEEQIHAREAYEALSSGKYHLVPRETLQQLMGGGTGATAGTKGTKGTKGTGKFNLINDEDEEQKVNVKVNFIDEE
jgi:hypothetical protein